MAILACSDPAMGAFEFTGCALDGEMVLFGLDFPNPLSFLASLGLNFSSLLLDPIEKWPFIDTLVGFSGGDV